MCVCRQWVAAAALALCVSFGRACALSAPRPLTDAEGQAVAACLTLVRGCQLPDGAFVQMNHGGKPHSPVWIAPYFANYAALALLAEYARTKSPADLDRVGRWLDWSVKHQSADGYWTDFEGGLEKPYPHGLAQLFGIAFIAPETNAWGRVTHAFAPETGPAAAAGTEWWLIAASRLGAGEAKTWRAKMVSECASFTPQAVYLSRPALAALGLLEGADWMTK